MTRLTLILLAFVLSCTQAVREPVRGGDGGQTCPTDGAERIGQKSTAAPIAEPQRLTPSIFYYFWVDTIPLFELWRVDISAGGDSPLVVAPTTGRACANTRRPWSEIVESGGARREVKFSKQVNSGYAGTSSGVSELPQPTQPALDFTYYLTLCRTNAWPWLHGDGYYVIRPWFEAYVETGDYVMIRRTWP